MTAQTAILVCAAILLISLAIWVITFRTRSVTKPHPERARRVTEAYLPLRDDSTFEFTIESVGSHDGGAMAFGLVTKGTVYEGYRLRLVRKSEPEVECVCRAIAGLSERLMQAGAHDGEKNVGLWLDVPTAGLKPYDRLLSLDTSASARQITPPGWKFSILHGVSK